MHPSEEGNNWYSFFLNSQSSLLKRQTLFSPSPSDFFVFQKDIKGRRAIERNIEIIGEAVSRILSIDPGINITNTRKIVDTRNRIIHGYDTVSEEIIWSVITRDIPKLENEINKLLKNQ
ncbi:MAG: DUF86 domain-containing protein [Bacteroidetes bacterium]|nr:DUF86 domain-containing protein [Bacteroidota bacterium]